MLISLKKESNEPELETLTINIASSLTAKKLGKTKEVSLDGFVEIPYTYLVHLHNSWIRYMDKESDIIHSGGFLNSCDFDTSVKIVYLRIPSKNEVIELEITKDVVFYVKKDNLNYQSIKPFIEENKRIRFEYNSLLAKYQEILRKIV